jgi:hypothetical protein
VKRYVCIAWLSGLAALVAGCAQPWPEDIPARTYTGQVVAGPFHVPAAGAEVHAERPTFKRSGLAIGLYTDDADLGSAKTDAEGRFTLRTETGYATSLVAETSDRRFFGTKFVKPDETANLRIIADEPAIGVIEFGGGVDPNLPVFKVIEPSLEQVIRYVSAHPHEPRHSLEDYAKHGVISQAALNAFTANASLFFGSKPRVKYDWGMDAIVIPDAHRPITLRRVKTDHRDFRSGILFE